MALYTIRPMGNRIKFIKMTHLPFSSMDIVPFFLASLILFMFFIIIILLLFYYSCSCMKFNNRTPFTPNLLENFYMYQLILNRWMNKITIINKFLYSFTFAINFLVYFTLIHDNFAKKKTPMRAIIS